MHHRRRMLPAALSLLAFAMLALTVGHGHDGERAGTGDEAALLGQAEATISAVHTHGSTSHDHGVAGCGPVACSGLIAVPFVAVGMPAAAADGVRYAAGVPDGRAPSPPYKPPRVRA